MHLNCQCVYVTPCKYLKIQHASYQKALIDFRALQNQPYLFFKTDSKLKIATIYLTNRPGVRFPKASLLANNGC